VPGYSQSLCSNLNFHSPIGNVVLVVVDVAVAWIKLPHNALVASLGIGIPLDPSDSARNGRNLVRIWSESFRVRVKFGWVLTEITFRSNSDHSDQILTIPLGSARIVWGSVKYSNLPVEPSLKTLSFFTVYMCHHINPHSINTYLSSIVQQLENTFLMVREAHNSIIVCCTLQGCMQMKGKAAVHKCALSLDDLHLVINHYQHSTSHNDLLFVAMLTTGFFGLMRLGELAFLNEKTLQNWKKSYSVTPSKCPHHSMSFYSQVTRLTVSSKEKRLLS